MIKRIWQLIHHSPSVNLKVEREQSTHHCISSNQLKPCNSKLKAFEKEKRKKRKLIQHLESYTEAHIFQQEDFSLFMNVVMNIV